MRYPNLRYGCSEQLQYFAMGIPTKDLAYRLRRDERTVKDWLQGRKKIPWWVPEILRLQDMEHQERVRQMGIYKIAPRLGIVSGDVITLPARPSFDQDAPAVVSDPSTITPGLEPGSHFDPASVAAYPAGSAAA